MSDRQKGLIKAVSTVFPLSQHCFCCTHLLRNFQSHHPDPLLAGLFWQASRASTEPEYRSVMEKMHAIDATAPQYFTGISAPEHWALWALKGFRWGQSSSNASESLNATLNPIRDHPILNILDEIQHLQYRWAEKARCAISKHIEGDGSSTINSPWLWSTHLRHQVIPEAQRQLDNTRSVARRYRIICIDDANTYLVKLADDANEHTVQFGTGQCTCKWWQDHGLPCYHAAAVALRRGTDLQDLCADFYRWAAYAGSYVRVANPVPPKDQWTLQPGLAPPNFKPKRGRKRASRLASHGEKPAKRRSICTRCKEPGHIRSNPKCPKYGLTSSQDSSAYPSTRPPTYRDISVPYPSSSQ